MISIVIPAYNEAKYIEKTLKQIPKNLEIIVVCDGCTDDTEKIAKKYAKTFVIKEKNVSLARNYGASKAKGDKIIFLDADTLINNNVLGKIAKIKSKSFVGTCKVKPDNNKLIARFYTFIKNIVGMLGIHNSSGMVFCTKDVFEKVKFNENLIKHENQNFTKRARKYAKRYFLNCYVTTSMRRFERLGYVNVPLYWIKEIFHKGKDYPIVR